ncbi:DUF3526 domain-containing protein [Flavivirga amylovorans]|uniref:DUF3526 domain-containing protein n=1 Tax=Flavivirga amylovorans TaxID=870486 RepID=A0ABT8X3L4_9FLAO|nr:DUF3526 domain-containing protein [Flavivirga amylovorans]MDO5988514.1 DUF3526 domain-containing protein [Flavivirga amylovorans]
MLKYNFKYEWLLLIRKRWIQVLTILLFILFGFAVYNGTQKVDARNASISSAINEFKMEEKKMLVQFDSIEKGFKVNTSSWLLPTRPIVIGNLHPRVVNMPAKSTAFISTGQSDMFAHYVQPIVTGDDSTMNFKEMTSPVQLLFGSFDLTFVTVYLLPLLIIAFSFNILASERESGSLKLLASQPINIRTWVLQKLGLRFFWLVIAIIITLSLVFIVFGFDFKTSLTSFMALLSIIITYTLFWFVLAFATNIWIKSSAKNAITLIGFWILFVLLSPSLINQISNTLYPIPSRILMLNEMRSIKAEATKKQDEILDNFLRDHPEYATNDSTQVRGFYQKYMATQQLIQDELKPLLSEFDSQINNQHKLVNASIWLSPALIVQNSLNRIAGTSTEDYQDFKRQSLTFSKEWRNFFKPMMFKDEKFKKSDYKNLPKFEFSYANVNTYGKTLGLVILSSLILFLVLVLKPRKNQIELIS